MIKVNFVSEFNLLMRYARNNALPARERMLWIALFHIANDRAIYNAETGDWEWPDGYFPVSIGELNSFCALDKRSIESLRESLHERGLIDYLPGDKKKANPQYRLHYLSVHVGYKNVPNDTPNDVPNAPPNTAPNDVPNPLANPLALYGKYNINTEKEKEKESKAVVAAEEEGDEAAATACEPAQPAEGTAEESEQKLTVLAQGCGLSIGNEQQKIMRELVREYGDGMVREAVKRCAGRSVQSWGYVRGILKSWREKGGIDAESPAKAVDGGKRVAAQAYTQRNYTDAELNSGTLELLREASELEYG